MRILQVRFKNLNSLNGEWLIDLTHPVFAADGIFAITGPTGAGKSTILDAICLALYGRTPRLSKVNRSGNEIMSRQTGECFSEVTFETRAGHYRCHWSQHRARKKPDGELQAPKHEIADAGSGKIFETKIRGVAQQIEDVTGMDFDRFTRSMLLAQGDFAKFLQAAADERAPILEQITGTEIYSRISVRVHELRSGERGKLEEIEAELAGILLLAPEDEQQLGESLEQQIRQEAALAKQIDQANEALVWLKEIAELEQDLQKLGKRKEAWRLSRDAFAAEQERLGNANRALELSGDYASLEALRGQQKSDRKILKGKQAALPASEAAVKDAEAARALAAEQLVTRRSEQQSALPAIRRVRDLDLKIDQIATPINKAETSIAELSGKLGAQRLVQEKDSAELEGARVTLQELQRKLQATQTDEGLVEHLAGIRGRCETLQKLHGRLTGKREEIAEAEGQFQEASRLSEEQSENLLSSKRARDKLNGLLAEKQEELIQVLENEDLADWRDSLSMLTEQKALIASTLGAVQTLSQSQQALAKLGEQKAALSAEKTALNNQLVSEAGKQAALEQQLELLESRFSLLKKIEDLEEARQRLQDGEPCPLCGAEEHPFAEGNIPAVDETRQGLTEVRSELKSSTGAISELKVKSARVDKDLQAAVSALERHAGEIDETSRLIAKACLQLSVNAADSYFELKLKELRDRNLQDLDHADGVVQAAGKIENETNSLRQRLENTGEEVRNAERDSLAAAHQKELSGQQLERIKRETDVQQSQLEEALGILNDELQAFTVETFSFETLDSVLEQLTARRDQWRARKKEQEKLGKTCTELEIRTRHQKEQIQTFETGIGEQQKILDSLLQEREALRSERRKAFGDRDAGREEQRLSSAVNAAEQVREEARQKSSVAERELHKLQSRIAELKELIATRDNPLKEKEKRFLEQLGEAGFSSKRRFLAARLPESERNELARQSQKLEQEKIEFTSMEAEKNRLLDAARRQRISKRPRSELEGERKTQITKQRKVQQDIGATRQKLETNAKLKQRQQVQLQAIEAQQDECSRWDLLHELIGSADGKKYRNFAQGLTFETVIGHANRQLQKMTDRYLLSRDSAQPLELNVMDNYQAGEVRSTKNLSGGESFIVSLSLALGLSRMASENVRVDSLFLDEGFGALDEEALDTALETLSSLQQDGKLIGVISHVPALKERIGVQIQVTPQTGGRSMIDGPGCGGG
ncbi:MAG: AAA family ATPase [Halieaceae bacterium]|nr:AAA family ATPase [Halieaceae bacterium]